VKSNADDQIIHMKSIYEILKVLEVPFFAILETKVFGILVLFGYGQTYSAIVNIAKIAIFNRFLVLLLQLQ